jgi:hypothetical protein
VDTNRDADRWDALADGTRRAIVACLADGPQAAGQLAALAGYADTAGAPDGET